MNCIKYVIKKQPVYEIDRSSVKSMKYAEYKRKACMKNVVLPYNFKELENKAWEFIEQKLKAPYAIDNDFSLFDDESRPFNLNKLTRADSDIYCNDILGDIRGVNTPYVYLGSFLSIFGFHTEDGNLNSLNYLHNGASKFWYIIPFDQIEKFEKLCDKYGKLLGVTCGKLSRHKSLMVPPSVLKANNIIF